MPNLTALRRGVFVLAAASLFSVATAAAQVPVLAWVEQSGTAADDRFEDIAADGAGGAFVTGLTSGAYAAPVVGAIDVIVARYDASGALLWSAQLGSPGVNIGYEAAPDGAGGVYICGYTSGVMPGESSAGQDDVFVARYDGAGALVWVRQIGSAVGDRCNGVAADAGGVLLTGITGGTITGSPTVNQGSNDIFVARFDDTGVLQWVNMLGSSIGDEANGVVSDGSGGALIGGVSQGTVPGSPTTNQGDWDIVAARFDASGTVQWVRMLGSSSFDGSAGATSDGAGGIVIAGHTLATLPGSATSSAGTYDAALVRYDATGGLIWVNQYGSPTHDLMNGVDGDGAGGYLLGGYSYGTITGSPTPSQGGVDAFIIHVDGGGVQQGAEMIGTSSTDFGMDVASDGVGGAFLGGWTAGTMPGETAQGDNDAFLARFAGAAAACSGAAPAWDGEVVTGGDSNRYIRVTAACGLDWVEFWNTNNLNLDGAFLSGDGGTSFTPAADYGAYSTGSCNVAEPGLTDCQGYEYTGTAGDEADELWIRISPTVPGNTSRFFLAMTDTEGTTTNIDPVLDGETADVLPAEPVLHGAYPNPFNPTTRVAFELPQSGAAHLAVYDVLGRRVATLFEGTAAAGRMEATWSGTDARGASVPSGVYLVRLEAGGQVLVRSMTLLK